MSNVEEYQNLVSILKSALEFYENKDNYVHPSYNNSLFSPVEMDCGAQARFALQNIQQFQNNHTILESEYNKSIGLGITEEESAKNLQKIIEEFKTLNESGNQI